MKTPYEGEQNSTNANVILQPQKINLENQNPNTQEQMSEFVKFRALLDQTDEIIFFIQFPDGRIVDINQAACKYLGYCDIEALKQKTIFDLVAETDVNETIRKVMTSVNGKNISVDSLVTTFHTQFGVPMPIELNIHSVHIKSEIYGVVVCHNISQRLKSEKALRASEGKYRSIYENAPIGIFQASPEGLYLSANPALLDILGFSSIEQLIQKNETIGSHFCKKIDDWQKILVELILSNEVVQYDGVYFRQNGEQIQGKLKIWAVKNKDGNIRHLEGLFENTTPQKLAQAQVERQIKHLESLRKIDTAIAANIDIDVMLNRVLEQIINQLHIDSANFQLFDPATQTLRPSAMFGYQAAITRPASMRLGLGLAGRAALERRPIKILDISRIEEEYKPFRAALGGEFKSYLAIPLIAKGEMKGVLEIFNRAPISPGVEWFEFLNNFAAQAAVAIDNAELFSNLQRKNAELTQAYDATIEGWSLALELRDQETQGHTLRTAELTVQLAKLMGLNGDKLTNIRRGALLHDIGKMGIPDEILLKVGPLSDKEQEIMRMHPVYAKELLSNIQFLHSAMDIPCYHHEHWDGKGYPQNLSGDEIPIAARVFAVVDVWDALLSNRPYRTAWSKADALKYIQEQSGSYFDPQVVEKFVKLIQSEMK